MFLLHRLCRVSTLRTPAARAFKLPRTCHDPEVQVGSRIPGDTGGDAPYARGDIKSAPGGGAAASSGAAQHVQSRRSRRTPEALHGPLRRPSLGRSRFAPSTVRFSRRQVRVWVHRRETWTAPCRGHFTHVLLPVLLFILFLVGLEGFQSPRPPERTDFVFCFQARPPKPGRTNAVFPPCALPGPGPVLTKGGERIKPLNRPPRSLSCTDHPRSRNGQKGSYTLCGPRFSFIPESYTMQYMYVGFLRRNSPIKDRSQFITPPIPRLHGSAHSSSR
jgi:hypothetical protein